MASRWLIALTLLSFTLLLGFSGWHAWEVDQANQQMLSRRLQSINRVFTPSLAEAAYVEEMARVHDLLVRLTSDPAIVNATLRDESGNARDFTGATSPPPLPSLPAVQTTWNHDGVLRWIQPLDDFASAASARRYWLDLSLDPQRADINGMRAFSAWIPALSLLLMIPLAVVWRRSRRSEAATSSAGIGAAESRVATPAFRRQANADDDLSYVSHELRAPLSGVLGFCRLLENSPLDAQQREWLRHIHLASNGLLDTVDHVLGDTRRGRADNVFDIAEVLWEVLCLQTPLAQSRGITLLTIVYDDVPPRLMGADINVRQLLTNLISNAVKYSDEGDVVIRVVLESRSGSTVRLRVSVSDSGGADSRHRLRLHRAIERGRGQTDAAEGVGIAICHRLVAEMNGWLALASSQGKGKSKGNTIVANIGLQACEPYVRPAEFDLEGAEIALWQPHARLGHLLDYALKRWHARPLSLTEPGSLTTLGDDSQLAIVGIDETALEPRSHRRWQQRFDAMQRPCLLLVNIGPTHALNWRLPEGSVVLRLPMSRYILGRTLAKMLAERRQRDLPPRPQILVVDDDEVSQHYLDALLPIIGASALVAGDAAEAVAIARERSVDLVLMDLHLPDASGFEATSRLRSLSREWKRKPVIAMTAEPDAHRQHLLRDPGIDEMLIKPLDESLLRSVLARYLPAAIAPATSATAATSPLPPVTEPAPSGRLASEEPPPSSPNQSLAASASRSGDLPVVDKALALRLSGHREALAEEMMSLLIASLPEYRQTLHAAWQRQDGDALGEIVHQLGGGCRYCGVPQLSSACETLETRCRRWPLDQCGDAFRELIAACDRLLVWADDQMITASH